MSGVSYNRVSKRLHASRGGGGSIEYWYYTLTPNKKIKTVMCGAYVDGVKMETYTTNVCIKVKEYLIKNGIRQQENG